MMNRKLFILSLILMHLAGGGSRVSIPYGLTFGQSIYFLFLLAFTLDFIQITLFFFLYSKASHLRYVKRLKDIFNKRKTRNKFLIWVKRFVLLEIFVIAASPFWGGGVWTSVLLAYLTKTRKILAYLIISAGLIFCMTIISIIAKTIIHVAGHTI